MYAIRSYYDFYNDLDVQIPFSTAVEMGDAEAAQREDMTALRTWRNGKSPGAIQSGSYNFV